MFIYVVKAGDSVFSISRKYGVSMESITLTKRLNELPGIVIGQALVIPSTGKLKNYGFIEVNAYIEPSVEEKERALINEVGNYLTYICPFSYQVLENGSLIPLKDENIISVSKNYKIAPLMVITNFKDGTFDTKLGHTILSDNTISQKLIDNVIATLRVKGYKGVNVDFERISPSDVELYNNFLRKLVSALRPLKYLVCTALAPKTSGAQSGAWYSAHDYKAHGEIVDFVILMTYEWGWSGGPPMAVAPINQVRAVLNYAVSVIPKKKIMMGMPLYGYDWTLPYLPNGDFAKRVSPQEAITIAFNNKAIIKFDEKTKSPFINYYDKQKVEHIIWFEDARSVEAKLKLASEYGLRGVSYWELGPSFPQNWYALDDMFKIVKVIN